MSPLPQEDAALVGTVLSLVVLVLLAVLIVLAVAA